MKLQEMLRAQGFDLGDNYTRLEVIRLTRKGNRVVYAITEDCEYLYIPVDGGEEEWLPCGASSTAIVVDSDDNVLNEGETLKQYFG